MAENYPNVTRLEVISEDGRELVRYVSLVGIEMQDGGQTMKIFIKDQESDYFTDVILPQINRLLIRKDAHEGCNEQGEGNE